METRVKICGITSTSDALYAAETGAGFLGYIFWAPSKRFIEPRNALKIIRTVRSAFPDVQHVGVFADAEPENVAWVRNLAGVDYVQLHGRETPAYCADLGSLGIDVIKTVGIGVDGPTIDITAYDAAFYLCDTHDDKLKGGTGRKFDLKNLPDFVQPEKLFLAGGLTPGNIAETLDAITPYAVDISSGVETSPGVKSHSLIKQFIDSVKNSNARKVNERSY